MISQICMCYTCRSCDSHCYLCVQAISYGVRTIQSMQACLGKLQARSDDQEWSQVMVAQNMRSVSGSCKVLGRQHRKYPIDIRA